MPAFTHTRRTQHARAYSDTILPTCAGCLAACLPARTLLPLPRLTAQNCDRARRWRTITPSDNFHLLPHSGLNLTAGDDVIQLVRYNSHSAPGRWGAGRRHCNIYGRREAHWQAPCTLPLPLRASAATCPWFFYTGGPTCLPWGAHCTGGRTTACLHAHPSTHWHTSTLYSLPVQHAPSTAACSVPAGPHHLPWDHTHTPAPLTTPLPLCCAQDTHALPHTAFLDGWAGLPPTGYRTLPTSLPMPALLSYVYGLLLLVLPPCSPSFRPLDTSDFPPTTHTDDIGPTLPLHNGSHSMHKRAAYHHCRAGTVADTLDYTHHGHPHPHPIHLDSFHCGQDN